MGEHTPTRLALCVGGGGGGEGEGYICVASHTRTRTHLQQLGILRVLHCKKLRLSIEAVMGEETAIPGLSELGTEWVCQWLLDLGLPQFQHVFLDACLDGHMLNVISMEDLRLLDVSLPFHIASIKSGLQALR